MFKCLRILCTNPVGTAWCLDWAGDRHTGGGGIIARIDSRQKLQENDGDFHTMFGFSTEICFADVHIDKKQKRKDNKDYL